MRLRGLTGEGKQTRGTNEPKRKKKGAGKTTFPNYECQELEWLHGLRRLRQEILWGEMVVHWGPEPGIGRRKKFNPGGFKKREGSV